MAFDERSSKRRKTSNPEASALTFTAESSLPLRFSHGEYLCLASAQIIIAPHPVNLETFAASLASGGNEEPFEVIVKSVDQIAGISLTNRTRKYHPTSYFASTNTSPSVSQVLEDCKKLDSALKYTRSPPIACYYATVKRTPGIDVIQYALELQILWRDDTDARESIENSNWEIWNKYFPKPGADFAAVREPWDPRQFYENVHVPDRREAYSADLPLELLECKLYPFQKRAVHWLLKREGVKIEKTGLVASISGPTNTLPPGFRQIQDSEGRLCYVHHALGVMSSNLKEIKQIYKPISGGILAEEMGLGKTVELIALMCLHRRDLTLAEDTGDITKSPATLIITPPTILKQWLQEIKEHAPSLDVYHYEGVKMETQRNDDVVSYLADHDIVLTTYNIIAKEVHYVEQNTDRSLRHASRFEKPKSPLTQISWWRVCLDEAQKVESGVSAAARVARMIPRVNAWAVTGTPLKKEHKDLFGLLLFLRYEPWCQSVRIWYRLVEFHRPLFRSLMSDIAIRHNKDFVRDDLRLPPQSRHTITVPFTAIEQQYYEQLFSQMCEEVGIDANGGPLSEEWDPESATVVEAMRRWLARLRQICLHPEVGGHNRRALGRTGGPLRSVFQVLEVMIDQNDAVVRAEQRAIILSKTRRGQLLENAKATQDAMDVWQLAYEESSKIVDECRTEYKLAFDQREQSRKVEEMTETRDDDELEEKENDTHLTACRQRLRSALEVKHICIFFIGNAYFQLKSDESNTKPDSDEFKELERKEEMAYEEAKLVRAELLSEVLKKANRFLKNMRSSDAKERLVDIPRMRLSLNYSGIESRKVFEKLHHYCEAMNSQADQYKELRETMVNFLQHSLIDEDEGITLKGDEYENSTKHQDEMYAYMEALRALCADRSDSISGQENVLIKHEMKMLLASAKAGEGPAPELMIKLMVDRKTHQVTPELGSLRGIVSEVRHLVTALQWQEGGGSTRARAELGIANEILQHCQKLVTAQAKAVTGLEQEVNRFRDTMNNRLEYYRALQKISDTVAPYEEENVGEPLDAQKYDQRLEDEEKKSRKLSTYLAKRRYLLHLKDESSSASTPRICTICQCDFEVGTLTVCGHQFCKECIQLWYSEHKNCPVCKRRLRGSDFWDITYKPAEMAIQEETSPQPLNSPDSSENTQRSLAKSIYSDISSNTLNEIKNIDLEGDSFGSKVDTICRHLIWLRYHDPGSKAIIFSQFREFLDVLGGALKQSKIAWARFDEKNGIEKFKSDPTIECFLLHAKAHSEGLNLVVANHVFLCEPLINTAIELQAIARVHRIGQQRATTVWMYLVADSVEEAIYEVSVARRTEHMKAKAKGKGKAMSQLSGENSRSGTATPSMENAIDSANSFELEAADLSRLLTTGKSGGEVVDTSDLWQCLFGRAKQREAGFAATQRAQQAVKDPRSDFGRFLRVDAVEKRANTDDVRMG